MRYGRGEGTPQLANYSAMPDSDLRHTNSHT
jgi:hypothetical protein